MQRLPCGCEAFQDRDGLSSYPDQSRRGKKGSWNQTIGPWAISQVYKWVVLIEMAQQAKTELPPEERQKHGSSFGSYS